MSQTGTFIMRVVVLATTTIATLGFATPASAERLMNHWYWPACLDMDVAQGGANGSKVQLWTCNGWPNQDWNWVDLGNGWFELRNGDNKCLDLDIAQPVGNGDRVQAWDCNGWANQQWRAEQQSDNPNAFRLVNRQYGCLDADWNGRYYDGKTVQIWACSWTDNQIWQP